MQEVQCSIEIEGPLQQVYALAKDVYSNPEWIPDLKSLVVVERSEDGNRILGEWTGVVKELRKIIKWTAEDVWDDQAHTCTLSLVNGHYGTYSGFWTFTDMGNTTRFDSTIKIDYNDSLASLIVRNLVMRKIRANLSSLLEAIKVRAEQGVIVPK